MEQFVLVNLSCHSWLRTSRRQKVMLTSSMLTNAWSSPEMRPRLQHAVISAFDRVAGGARTQRTRRPRSGWSPPSSVRGRRPASSCRACRAVMQPGSGRGPRGWPQHSGRHPNQEERLVALFSGDTRAAIDAAASIQAVQPDAYLSLFKEYAVQGRLTRRWKPC
jgi:hypothetical protein